MNEPASFDVTPHRNVENQLFLSVRALETAMTQPSFERKKPKLLSDAQDTYWGALLTLMAIPEPAATDFQPVQAQLRRLRSALTAFKY